MDRTDSIYVNNDYSKVVGAVNMIAARFMELDTCEELLKMGYRFCNNVPLEERAQWLSREIARLEKLKKVMKGAHIEE